MSEEEHITAGFTAADGFVGRVRELTLLGVRLAAAIAGRGGMAMLVGEPGIGKTRCAQELAELARAQGAMVLWGRCYEGEWAPPYGPWVEAIGDYVRTRSPEELRAVLAAGTMPLAGLVPELRTALPEVPAAIALGSEEERVRLYDAVLQFLLTIARGQPLLLVLEDLHWTDRASLGLLRHLAHFVGRAPLLVLGTYRDVEVDREHPLATVLPVLRHETDYERVPLHGLDDAETATYLAQMTRRELMPPLARAIRQETAGNPFYLGQVFRHLLEEGKLEQQDGRWATTADADPWGVPEGVREVVGRRLARLQPETRRMLELAAAFTGGFDFEVICALSGLEESVGLDCIDEALESRLIRSIRAVPARYDFVHALVRHSLYEPLNLDRRARLHRRIAQTLERRYGSHAGAHAAELAYQYHASRALAGAEAGISHCLEAARQATAAYASEQAVTYLRMARDLTGGSSDSLRREILQRLAVEEAEALMLEEARVTADAALALMAASGTAPGQTAAFIVQVARALKDGGAHPSVWEPLVARGLADVEGSRGLPWARLTLLRDPVESIASGPVNASRWLGFDPEAVAIVSAEGDEEDYARTLEPFGGRNRAETDATLALARGWQRPAAAMRALSVAGRELLYRHGAHAEAVERFRELLAESERYGSLTLHAEAWVHLGHGYMGLGDLASAETAVEHAHDLVDRLGTLHRLHGVLNGVDILRAYLRGGNWPLLARRMAAFYGTPETYRDTLGLTGAAYVALGDSQAGNDEAAERRIALVLPLLQQAGATAWTHNGAVTLIGAAVWDLQAAAFAPAIHALAIEILTAGLGDFPFLPTKLTAARMAALAGRFDDAISHFAQARAAAMGAGQRPASAITDLDEAQTLIRAGSQDRARIVALFDAALAEFRALEMMPWIERALRYEQALITPRRARAAAAYPDNLTPREVDVLRLIAAGRTNSEIADSLVLSVRTVGRHITNIYGKIGARGKADATTYALAHHLTDLTTS